MRKTNVYDCSMLEIDKHHNEKGNISVVENARTIPFGVKRVYYLYDVPGGESRGGHAHKELQQFIVAASGSFDVTIDDGQIIAKKSHCSPSDGVQQPLFILPSSIGFSISTRVHPFLGW